MSGKLMKGGGPFGKFLYEVGEMKRGLHDACGCPFIDDTSMDSDVLYLDWYLNSNGGGKTRCANVKVKGDESSIGRVDCAQSEK